MGEIMTTEQLLNLKCDTDKNKQTLNKALFKVKPVSRMAEKLLYTKTEQLPVEMLETIIHGLMKKYNIMMQAINPYYDEQKDIVFYTCSVQIIIEHGEHKTREWIGNTYGKTLWELYAKTIIFIVQKIKDQKEGKEIKR